MLIQGQHLSAILAGWGAFSVERAYDDDDDDLFIYHSRSLWLNYSVGQQY